MSIELFKLEGIGWWVEADTVKKVVLNQYEKVAVEATISQIESQLALLPDPKEKEAYYSGIITLINASTYPSATKLAAVAFMAEMWEDHGMKQEQSEAAELRARLVREQALLARLV